MKQHQTKQAETSCEKDLMIVGIYKEKELGVDSYDMSNNITLNSQLSNIKYQIIYSILLQIRVAVES